MKFKRFKFNTTEVLYLIALALLEAWLFIKAVTWMRDALDLKVIPNFPILCLLLVGLSKTLFYRVDIDEDKHTAETKLLKVTAKTILVVIHFALFYLFLFYFQN